MASRLYIGKLSPRTRTEDLEQAFKRFGTIKTCDMKAGFAFVEFEDPRDADEAIRSMNGSDLDGCRIIVEPARGPGPRIPGDARCFTCGQEGHWARDCPNARTRGNGCYICGDSGHFVFRRDDSRHDDYRRDDYRDHRDDRDSRHRDDRDDRDRDYRRDDRDYRRDDRESRHRDSESHRDDRHHSRSRSPRDEGHHSHSHDHSHSRGRDDDREKRSRHASRDQPREASSSRKDAPVDSH